MLLDEKNWYYFNDFKDKIPSPAKNYQVRTFCNRKEYEAFILTSSEEMNKLRYEDEVGGFSVLNTFEKPYPVYCASMTSSDIQHILDKYEIQGIWVIRPTVQLTYE